MTTRRYCGYCGADYMAAADGAYCGRCGGPRDGTDSGLSNPAGVAASRPDMLQRLGDLTVRAASPTPTRQIIVATTLLITTLILLGTAYHLLLGSLPLLLIALALHLWLPRQQAPRSGQAGQPARPARSTRRGRATATAGATGKEELHER